jgi:hypothetical protein
MSKTHMQVPTQLFPVFINYRLCLSVLPANIRDRLVRQAPRGYGQSAERHEDQLLTDTLRRICEETKKPTLEKALTCGSFPCLFHSSERLAPCPGVHDKVHVDHAVELGSDLGKPIRIAYHTSHIVSDTGRNSLFKGSEGSVGIRGHEIIGIVHDKRDRFEIQPLVLGMRVPSFLMEGLILHRPPAERSEPTPRDAGTAATAERNQRWLEERQQRAGKEPRTETAARIAKRDGEKTATVYRTLSRLGKTNIGK